MFLSYGVFLLKNWKNPTNTSISYHRYISRQPRHHYRHAELHTSFNWFYFWNIIVTDRSQRIISQSTFLKKRQIWLIAEFATAYLFSRIRPEIYNNFLITVPIWFISICATCFRNDGILIGHLHASEIMESYLFPQIVKDSGQHTVHDRGISRWEEQFTRSKKAAWRSHVHYRSMKHWASNLHRWLHCALRSSRRALRLLSFALNMTCVLDQVQKYNGAPLMICNLRIETTVIHTTPSTDDPYN